jgi:hypothetical protein
VSVKDLIELAEESARASTVTYPTWKSRLDAGKYQRPETTAWWKVFDYLAQAKKASATVYPGPGVYPS